MSCVRLSKRSVKRKVTSSFWKKMKELCSTRKPDRISPKLWWIGLMRNTRARLRRRSNVIIDRSGEEERLSCLIHQRLLNFRVTVIARSVATKQPVHSVSADKQSVRVARNDETELI